MNEISFLYLARFSIFARKYTTMIIEELQNLYQSYTGVPAENITELPSSGSNRRYFRLTGIQVLIGVYGASIDENEAFLYMAEHFRKCGLPVPDAGGGFGIRPVRVRKADQISKQRGNIWKTGDLRSIGPGLRHGAQPADQRHGDFLRRAVGVGAGLRRGYVPGPHRQDGQQPDCQSGLYSPGQPVSDRGGEEFKKAASAEAGAALPGELPDYQQFRCPLPGVYP